MTGKNIIIVGQQPWDVAIGSNCKNIALEFSRDNRVLYVNAPLDRITSVRNRKDPKVRKRLDVIKGKTNGLQQVNANLWTLYPDCLVESVNWLSAGRLFEVVNKRNNRRFAKSILAAASQLGIRSYVLFNDNEVMKCLHLPELLAPELSVYYSRDYIVAAEYWKKHAPWLEPKMIARTDLCVANSVYLADYCRQYNPKAYYVGQGCELDLFQQSYYPVPAALGGLQRPLIGYVGSIVASRLDIDLIAHIARQHPAATVVLVGPQDEVFAGSRLHQEPNIVFTGPKDAGELPAFINAFDVCINPQLVNDLTRGNYPRKVDEYLAMGKPVVATATCTMESFREHVYLAHNKEEFATLIGTALAADEARLQADRKAFAATHTWHNSVQEIYKAINLS